MGTSERQLLRAWFAWLCKWLLLLVRGRGRFTVNLMCLPAHLKKKKRKTNESKKLFRLFNLCHLRPSTTLSSCLTFSAPTVHLPAPPRHSHTDTMRHDLTIMLRTSRKATFIGKDV